MNRESLLFPLVRRAAHALQPARRGLAAAALVGDTGRLGVLWRFKVPEPVLIAAGAAAGLIPVSPSIGESHEMDHS